MTIDNILCLDSIPVTLHNLLSVNYTQIIPLNLHHVNYTLYIILYVINLGPINLQTYEVIPILIYALYVIMPLEKFISTYNHLEVIMSFQRARSEAQIQKRISEITEAASAIYNTEGFEALSFSKISEYTQFTRPTIYKYFSTKEEILLKIMIDDMDQWVNQLISSFKINKLYTIEEIADILSHTLSTSSRLVELFTFLFTTIEKNVSKASLIDFKVKLFGYQDTLLKLFSELFPHASNEQIDHFLETLLALAIGLYPMCHLSKTQLEAICILVNNYTPPEFEKIYRQNIYQNLYCLQNNINVD